MPYWDDVVAGAMGESFSKPFDLLLGRRTYDIFAAHWPHQVTDPNDPGFVPGEGEIARMFNEVTKYVATHRPESLNWQNSELLGDDIIASLRAIKATEGPDLSVSGSSELVHQLLASDLVDELRLLIYPVILGKGKRLFDGNPCHQPSSWSAPPHRPAASSLPIISVQANSRPGLLRWTTHRKKKSSDVRTFPDSSRASRTIGVENPPLRQGFVNSPMNCAYCTDLAIGGTIRRPLLKFICLQI